MSGLDPTVSPDETADKLGVVDALYRYAAGIDLKDKALLESAVSVEIVLDPTPATTKIGFDYPVLEGRDTVVAVLLDSLDNIETTHSVSNPRVRLAGDRAHLEAIVAAQHLPRNDHSRHILLTNRFDLELIKHGDHWLIERLIIDNVWLDGDLAVLSGTSRS